MSRNHEPAAARAGLASGYCASCDRTVMPLGLQYAYDHPEHYDGVSEWQCAHCGRREGRWTKAVLTDGASEPRLGVEREENIEANMYRIPQRG